jgi:hypothetical protein
MNACSSIQNQQLLIHVMRTKLNIYQLLLLLERYLSLEDYLAPEGNIRPDLSDLLDISTMTAYISSTSICRYISTFSTCAFRLSIGNKKQHSLKRFCNE